MNPKTLYVSDMDGTLLNSQSKLSETTIKALNEVIEKHHALFTVATARTPATVVPLMQPINTSLPFIVMAGAAMWDNQLLAYKSVQTIPADVVEQLSALFTKHGLHPFIYRQHGNRIHAHHIRQLTSEEEQFINSRLSTPFKRFILSDSGRDCTQDECMLIFCMGAFEKLNSLYNQLKSLQLDCSPVCYHDIINESAGILEIYAAGTTKASAIRRLAQETQASRIVVFGDNLNDLPMMKEASYSIAVSNAFDEVKQEADEIIASNNDDAVAKWILQDIINNKCKDSF